MLVRSDLGFVAVIVVVLTVIWFVIRRKWRIAAARREEIKRLLVFAAEESARAEFEATVLYETAVKEEFVSEKLPVVKNQCALCFSPAAKLCSQCKAVRYCSGKCQIIHWRQGHKQECRPYTIFDKGNEGKFASQKEFNQEEYASYGENYELDKRQDAKQVKTFPENYTDIGNSDLLHRKDDIEGQGLSDDVESNSSATSHLSEGSSELTNTSSEASLGASVYISNDTDGLTRIQTATGIPVKSKTSMDMDQNRSQFTEKSSNLKKSSIKSGQYKPVCSDGDGQSFSCSSSGWSVDDSSDSLSEPATPSCGFWEGTINSRRSTNGANDDGTQSSSSDSGGDVMSGPVSSLGISAGLAKNLTPAMPQQGFNSYTMISDGLSASRTKRYVSEAASSVKLSKDSLKSMKSTSLNSEMSASMHGDTGYNSRVLKCRETKSSSSSIHCAVPYANDQGHLPMKDIKKISNLPPLCSERSKVGSDTISSSRASKSQEVGYMFCKDPDTRLKSHGLLIEA